MADNNTTTSQAEIEAHLARIRKTIAESEHLVSQAELRIAETDRMLETQGLSREQVLSMRFSEAQVEAMNAELKRRGMDPLEEWGLLDENVSEAIAPAAPAPVRQAPYSGDDELEERRRKFGMMMKPFQI